MKYFAYLLLGPWLGKVALLLAVIGVTLLLIPNLTQPIHGYKIRKILGCFIIICAFSIASALLINGQEPISSEQKSSLVKAIEKTHEGNMVFEHYGTNFDELTKIDYVALSKALQRKRHPHFRRSKNTEVQTSKT